MSRDARLDAARRLLLELAAAAPSACDPKRLEAVLAGLEDVGRQTDRFLEMDQRLQEVADALFGLASLDFSKRPGLRGDGSVLDAVVGCVNMLSEELSAYLGQRTAAEQELERRVEARTAALTQANEELRHEIGERIRAEEALRTSEAQLRQAAKVEALGKLSGGIAHDFNNLLSVILSYTWGLLEELPASHPMREDLEEVRRAGQRAADLTRQLLAFSRRHVMELQSIHLNELVSSTASLLHRLIGEDIELKLDLEPRLGRVRVDPGQLVQVVMNLAVNARDAMPSGGTLCIRTANVELEGASEAPVPGLAPGRYVLLRVTDTGVGMDEATQARLFEPFFTTKAPGAGTGLGLPTVLGIVQQRGGAIGVRSRLGQGTTFDVYLPRDEGSAPPATAESAGRMRPDHGDEVVLLVEDDEQVRQLVRRILQHNGYEVLEAATPEAAQVLFEQYGGSIDLLLADVVMPRMSGRQLAEQLLRSHRDLKVLYMSGYTEDVALQHGVVESSVSFLSKPITPRALLRKLREVLDP
ncbi:response regulator [Archangium gephyra]|uniref:ATP-binding protein n=1 Tax=Archangium gephyra TaxID=48 RepID=UPI0035D4DE50